MARSGPDVTAFFAFPWSGLTKYVMQDATDMFTHLLQNRIIFIGQRINDEVVKYSSVRLLKHGSTLLQGQGDDCLCACAVGNANCCQSACFRGSK